MSHVILTLRHSFEVDARLPRRPVARHAVSREVPVRISVLDPDDAPVALVIRRPLGKTEKMAHLAWVNTMGEPCRKDDRQEIPLRLADRGLLAPVLGPDMLTHVAPDEVAPTLARWPNRLSDISYGLMANWPGYPGESRDSPGKDPRRDFFRGHAHPGPPLHLCPDVAGYRDVRDGVVTAADAAFHARVEGLCVIEGRLWQPCGTPLVAMGFSKPWLVIPGIDPFEGHFPGAAPALAVGDFRSGPAARALAGTDIEAPDDAPDAPWADTTVPNLRLLHARATQHLAGARFRDVPRMALGLVDAIDAIPAALREGEDTDAVRDHLVEAVAEVAAADHPNEGGFYSMMHDARRWRLVVVADGRDRALAVRDPGLGGFSP